MNEQTLLPAHHLDERLKAAEIHLNHCFSLFEAAMAAGDSTKAKSARADIERATHESHALHEEKKYHPLIGS